ncbi:MULTISPECIES: hypothetical protein [Stenotrophomonas]|uniref:Uncharacterized protein n=2 Tax=Gammaproteobacteria TaxID=1236 RepID=A0AAI9FUY2_STEMA|nr:MULTISPECIES: hypothetical protein [Stenotrophomonas]EKT4092274.1 hypothetical protein [Stenotrophomonas maltophilia]ELF4102860.1 hypothetical protein [Stenotrophomonas maltophilia]WQI22236.1 hypothetical protein U2S91_06240 [Stenotrophomonas maltophilia]HDS1131650.1 hypothetical protein [Stenotrophomonas maltophilia]HDS1155022.1 hypothetical protein [Stenotrophomonas maltophilia]
MTATKKFVRSQSSRENANQGKSFERRHILAGYIQPKSVHHSPHLSVPAREKHTLRPKDPKQHTPERKTHALNLAYPKKSKTQVTPFEFKHPPFRNFPNITY